MELRQVYGEHLSFLNVFQVFTSLWFNITVAHLISLASHALLYPACLNSQSFLDVWVSYLFKVKLAVLNGSLGTHEKNIIRENGGRDRTRQPGFLYEVV